MLGLGPKADFCRWWVCSLRLGCRVAVEFGVGGSALFLKLQAELEQKLQAIGLQTAAIAAQTRSIDLQQKELPQKIQDLDARLADIAAVRERQASSAEDWAAI